MFVVLTVVEEGIKWLFPPVGVAVESCETAYTVYKVGKLGASIFSGDMTAIGTAAFTAVSKETCQKMRDECLKEMNRVPAIITKLLGKGGCWGAYGICVALQKK